MIWALLVLLPAYVFGCDLSPCTCNMILNTLECPPGRYENPSSCGSGFTLTHRKCDLASIVRPKLPAERQSAEVFEPPIQKYEPAYLNSPSKSLLNPPAPDLNPLSKSLSNPPGPESPMYPEPSLERSETFPSDLRSIAKAIWKLIADSDFDELNVILGSITLAITLLNSAFTATIFRRQRRQKPPPPVHFGDRYRLDSDRDSVASSEDGAAFGTTQPEVHGNGTQPAGAAPGLPGTHDLIQIDPPATTQATGTALTPATENDEETEPASADAATLSGRGKKLPPNVPPKPIRLMTTEELRLSTFLERCGEGRYLLIVRSGRGRLTMAPVLYPR